MNKLLVSRWCVTALALYTYTKFEDTMTKVRVAAPCC